MTEKKAPPSQDKGKAAPASGGKTETTERTTERTERQTPAQPNPAPQQSPSTD